MQSEIPTEASGSVRAKRKYENNSAALCGISVASVVKKEINHREHKVDTESTKKILMIKHGKM